jgi:D-serine deaminase-like pyridoxal phosphate-dependent protein
MKNTTFFLREIIEPTMLLDEKICKENIRRLAQKARDRQVIFRPHFKTHQSKHIGNWFRQVGVEKITVSSLKMAEYFSEDGWKDITVAFPANILEMERIQKLASSIRLNLLVESLETINFLEQKLKSVVNAFVKIDVGYHRTGIAPDNIHLIETLIETIEKSSSIKFAGFLGHAGHSYQARTKHEIEEIHFSSIGMLIRLKELYKKRFPEMIISTGDTPTCSVMDDFEGIDEIRPGNFVFYDLTQSTIGSCAVNDIAVAMACPIVAKHKERNELIIYGGGVHFSKDRLTLAKDGQVIFGTVVDINNAGWKMTDGDNSYVTKLSQEHGTIKATTDVFDRYNVGDIIGVLPIHSCLAANLMKQYLTFDGKWIDRL